MVAVSKVIGIADLDAETYEALELIAKREDRSISGQCRHIIRKFVEKQKNN